MRSGWISGCGARKTPVIERRFPLAAAAEAVGHVAGGHARGKTVIVV
jgi:NADPH:quinone reductase-like Zn-dependent oxidoreductase